MKSNYRKNIRQFSLLFVAFFGLCSSHILMSCTQEEETTKSSEILPLSISSVKTMMNKEETRSTTALTDGQIGVFRLADSSAGLEAMNNILYTGVSGTWTPLTTNVMATNTTQTVAYYPYNSSYNDPTQLPLTSALSTSYLDKMLYNSSPSTGTISGQVCQSAFTLTPAYAVVKFVLSGEAITGAANVVNSLNLYHANLPVSTTMNITGSNVTYGAMPKQTSMNINLSNSNTLASGVNVYLIVPPCTLYDASHTILKIVTTIDGIGYLQNLDLTTSVLGGALKAGYMYTINLNFSQGSSNVVQEANCYMMQAGSTIYVPVSLAEKGNPTKFNAGASFTTGVVWSDVSGGNVTVAPQGRLIKVTSTAIGNSVICIKDGVGNILWSWHIWVTNYKPDENLNGTTFVANGETWMDRNLGATDAADGTKTYATCGGLMYQWGRKDPFPGSNGTSATTAKTIYLYTRPTTIDGATPVNTVPGDSYVTSFAIGSGPVTYANVVDYSILFPLVAFDNWAGSTATAAANDTDESGGRSSWLYNSTRSVNLLYDPCPPGWEAANFNYATTPWTSPWNGFTVASWTTGAFTGYSSLTGAGIYPAAGYRTATGGLTGVGSLVKCYSSAIVGASAYYLNVSSYTTIDSKAQSNRSDLMNVRCVKL